jgi:flavin reductase (DIM6/NTAB) family NADH-FMN oxidoreductase RutF
MEKVDISFTDLFKKTVELFAKRWLIVSVDNDGKPNVMTLGAGGFVSVPGGYSCIVYISPSRYTYGLLEKSANFTINVPREGMEDAVKHCGSVSGRDHDKFADLKLSVVPARKVASPIIGECAIHLECEVTDIMDPRPESFAGSIKAYYEEGNSTDYHRCFKGVIVAAYGDEDWLDVLSES